MAILIAAIDPQRIRRSGDVATAGGHVGLRCDRACPVDVDRMRSCGCWARNAAGADHAVVLGVVAAAVGVEPPWASPGFDRARPSVLLL